MLVNSFLIEHRHKKERAVCPSDFLPAVDSLTPVCKKRKRQVFHPMAPGQDWTNIIKGFNRTTADEINH